MQLKTYKVDNPLLATLPTNVWDPRWREPVVAATVAMHMYRRIRSEPAPEALTVLCDPAAMPQHSPKHSERAEFPLSIVNELEDGTRFRGSSFGELFKQYKYGGHLPNIYFHAQAVMFGVDATGRFFLDARIGRVEGATLGYAELMLAFATPSEVLGFVACGGELDKPRDFRVRLCGNSDLLAKRFDELALAKVSFLAKAEARQG